MKFDPVDLPGHEGRLGYFMHTFTGKRYFPCDPRVEEVDILDIARGLAFQPRFNGQTLKWYSIAEHSVFASMYEVDSLEDAFAKLMHDAPEAYISDLIRPLKLIPQLRVPYLAIEEKNEAVVCQRFGIKTFKTASVKRADEAMVTLEMRDNIRAEQKGHLHDASNIAPFKLEYWSPLYAEGEFLQRFYQLCPEHLR